MGPGEPFYPKQRARLEPLFDLHPRTGVSIEVFYGDRTLETFGRCGAGWFWWSRRRGFAPAGPATGPFATSYAAEELIAELGAAFLCAEFGFDGDVRSAGYIGNWIELLEADKRAFFTACSQASKAADYLRGLALAQPAERAA